MSNFYCHPARAGGTPKILDFSLLEHNYQANWIGGELLYASLEHEDIKNDISFELEVKAFMEQLSFMGYTKSSIEKAETSVRHRVNKDMELQGRLRVYNSLPYELWPFRYMWREVFYL